MTYVLLESGGLEVAEKYCETIVKQLKHQMYYILSKGYLWIKRFE